MAQSYQQPPPQPQLFYDHQTHHQLHAHQHYAATTAAAVVASNYQHSASHSHADASYAHSSRGDTAALGLQVAAHSVNSRQQQQQLFCQQHTAASTQQLHAPQADHYLTSPLHSATEQPALTSPAVSEHHIAAATPPQQPPVHHYYQQHGSMITGARPQQAHHHRSHIDQHQGRTLQHPQRQHQAALAHTASSLHQQPPLQHAASSEQLQHPSHMAQQQQYHRHVQQQLHGDSSPTAVTAGNQSQASSYLAPQSSFMHHHHAHHPPQLHQHQQSQHHQHAAHHSYQSAHHYQQQRQQQQQHRTFPHAQLHELTDLQSSHKQAAARATSLNATYSTSTQFRHQPAGRNSPATLLIKKESSSELIEACDSREMSAGSNCGDSNEIEQTADKPDSMQLLIECVKDEPTSPLTLTSNGGGCGGGAGSMKDAILNGENSNCNNNVNANNGNNVSNTTTTTTGRSKRVRTSFKQCQLKTMKTWFEKNKNPDGKDLRLLSMSTGLTKRVLQVWFQNARAKFRRQCAKVGIPISEAESHSSEMLEVIQQSFNFRKQQAVQQQQQQQQQQTQQQVEHQHQHIQAATANNYSQLGRTYSTIPQHHQQQ